MAQTTRTIPAAWRAATYQTLSACCATGLRVGEALRLQCSDVDWDEGVIYQTGVHSSASPDSCQYLRPQ